MDQKEKELETAKIAEQAERYDDMVEAMKVVVKLANGDLKDEERNLLSVAYKNVVGAKRSAWRILKSVEDKASEGKKKNLASEYCLKIEGELNDKCNEVLTLIDEQLFPSAQKSQSENAAEARVFYLKMKGDYYRYQVEILKSDDASWDALKDMSLAAYEEAGKEGETLKPTHPIRLGLALNFSVFYYEIASEPNKACQVAQTAFDAALADLEQVPEDTTYKDSTLIMQLLRDNLTLWNRENLEEKDGEGE